MEKPYKPSQGSDLEHYVDGPGDGLGYYGGTLFPELRCRDKEESERATSIANIAYQEGYRRAQADMRRSLGLSTEA